MSGGDDDDAEAEGDESGETRTSSPSFTDYLMHFLTIFWKVLFAFVPPTGEYYFALDDEDNMLIISKL